MNNISIVNILKVVGLIIVAGFVLNIALGLLSGVLWFAIKILIPVAIAIWLVRKISEPRNTKRYY